MSVAGGGEGWRASGLPSCAWLRPLAWKISGKYPGDGGRLMGGLIICWCLRPITSVRSGDQPENNGDLF